MVVQDQKKVRKNDRVVEAQMLRKLLKAGESLQFLLYFAMLRCKYSVSASRLLSLPDCFP